MMNNWSCFRKKEESGWDKCLGRFGIFPVNYRLQNISEFRETECNESHQGHPLQGSGRHIQCTTNASHQPHAEGINVIFREETWLKVIKSNSQWEVKP